MSANIALTRKVALGSGSKVFYREAGLSNKKTILLLHGFPTSSFMFRNLIPVLAAEFHVVAPDLPGFGYTKVSKDFTYSFEKLTDVVEEFVDTLKLNKFAIYIFDYGAPTGLRLALRNPSRITGIITQNGNAYVEGLNKTFWGPLQGFWAGKDRNASKFVKPLEQFLSDPKHISDQYSIGFNHPDHVDPTPITLDKAFAGEKGRNQIQLDLFFDYGTNVELYPKFQEYFKSSNVPILVAWGKNDYIFTVEGAEAFKRGSKNVEYLYVSSGHFALESEHFKKIADKIVEFLNRI